MKMLIALAIVLASSAAGAADVALVAPTNPFVDARIVASNAADQASTATFTTGTVHAIPLFGGIGNTQLLQMKTNDIIFSIKPPGG